MLADDGYLRVEGGEMLLGLVEAAGSLVAGSLVVQHRS